MLYVGAASVEPKGGGATTKSRLTLKKTRFTLQRVLYL